MTDWPNNKARPVFSNAINNLNNVKYLMFDEVNFGMLVRKN